MSSWFNLDDGQTFQGYVEGLVAEYKMRSYKSVYHYLSDKGIWIEAPGFPVSDAVFNLYMTLLEIIEKGKPVDDAVAESVYSYLTGTWS